MHRMEGEKLNEKILYIKLKKILPSHNLVPYNFFLIASERRGWSMKRSFEWTFLQHWMYQMLHTALSPSIPQNFKSVSHSSSLCAHNINYSTLILLYFPLLLRIFTHKRKKLLSCTGSSWGAVTLELWHAHETHFCRLSTSKGLQPWINLLELIFKWSRSRQRKEWKIMTTTKQCCFKTFNFLRHWSLKIKVSVV